MRHSELWENWQNRSSDRCLQEPIYEPDSCTSSWRRLGDMYSPRDQQYCTLLCLVPQSCLTLCDPMGCSPPGSSVHRDSPGKNTGMGCHSLLQGNFPTQESNGGLLHCRWVLYQLSFPGVLLLPTSFIINFTLGSIIKVDSILFSPSARYLDSGDLLLLMFLTFLGVLFPLHHFSLGLHYLSFVIW